MTLEGSRSPAIQRGPIIPRFAVPHSGGLMERILVVEDDRAVQKALKRLFEAEGFTVEISGDGKSALEAYRAAAPSAVVLDLRLSKTQLSQATKKKKKKKKKKMPPSEEGSTGGRTPDFHLWRRSTRIACTMWMNHIIDPKVNAQVAEQWFGRGTSAEQGV